MLALLQSRTMKTDIELVQIFMSYSFFRKSVTLYFADYVIWMPVCLFICFFNNKMKNYNLMNSSHRENPCMFYQLQIFFLFSFFLFFFFFFFELEHQKYLLTYLATFGLATAVRGHCWSREIHNLFVNQLIKSISISSLLPIHLISCKQRTF